MDDCNAEAAATEETLRAWVGSWRGANDDGGPGYFDPAEGSWTYDPAFQVQKLIDGGVFENKEAARGWLLDEIDMHRGEGNEARAAEYESLLRDPIRDAVYLTEVDGKISVWDGWHRSAAAIAKEDATIAVVLGKPYPDIRPDRQRKHAAHR